MASHSDDDLMNSLADSDAQALDSLPFGVIGLRDPGIVTSYNGFEQQTSGFPADRVLGRSFFTEIAPCTNNSEVRGRFVEAWEQGRECDELLEYSFAYKGRDTPVQLRLLVKAAQGWLVVKILKPDAST